MRDIIDEALTLLTHFIQDTTLVVSATFENNFLNSGNIDTNISLKVVQKILLNLFNQSRAGFNERITNSTTIDLV